jgi:hypothetical protein
VLTSLQRLLSSIVDYAGLFPPARLSLADAMLVYDRARTSTHHWMLDRFVLPAPRLPEFVDLLPSIQQETQLSRPWSLSVILSRHWARELEQIQPISNTGFQQGFWISAVEVSPLLPAEIQQVCDYLPVEVSAFFEIPFDADLVPYLDVLQKTGAAAKLRTGGITSDAFPDSVQLSQRILSLAKAEIPFKATAGLHHALRGNYPLTCPQDGVSVTMQGFLTVAILAAFAQQQGITPEKALAILAESAIAPFQFTEATIRWGDRTLSLAEIDHSRQQFFRSFGSCSLQELIDDLNYLGLL